jgi:hypothetical protein
MLTNEVCMSWRSNFESTRPRILTWEHSSLLDSKNQKRMKDEFSLVEAFYTCDVGKHANQHDTMRVLSHVFDQPSSRGTKSMHRRTNDRERGLIFCAAQQLGSC